MVIYVLDKNFNIVGLIDEFESLIWRSAYNEIGDFELYLNASSEVIELLKKDYYLVRSTDITIEDGNTTYTNVMIIKNFNLKTDVEEGDHYRLTGKELKFILKQRIVWTQTNLSGKVEESIRKLVTENAINPTDSNRIILNLVLGSLAGFTETMKKQITGTRLDEAIIDICKTYNYGWDIFVYNQQMVFIVYRGLDRSYAQTDRPYVVFSDEFDNILNSEYQLSSEDYANCCLVAGEGEGKARKTSTINNNLSGLDRYELYVDARDLSQNKDSSEAEDIISDEDYDVLLQERGQEQLAELQYTEGFSGEVLDNFTFKYNEDFFMGDIVTVVNKYGLTKNVQVISAIESIDENGTTLIPQFNI